MKRLVQGHSDGPLVFVLLLTHVRKTLVFGTLADFALLAHSQAFILMTKDIKAIAGMFALGV